VLKQAMTQNKSQLITTPSTGGRWISMNTTVKPFDNLNVRKAVLAGFDRDALRLTRGGEPRGRSPPTSSPPRSPASTRRAGTRARATTSSTPAASRTRRCRPKYFKKAGYPSGKYTGGEKLLMVGANTGVAAARAEVTKQQFEDMGFKVTLRLVRHRRPPTCATATCRR
jgi:peptide/nickel transport system substrate-binding protein